MDDEQQSPQSEVEAERPMRFLEETLQHAQTLIFVMDTEKRLVFANLAVEQLWGMQRAGYIGRRVGELGYPADLAERIERQIDQVIATRRPVGSETPYVNPTGVFGYYDYVMAPMLDADGKVENVVGVSHDSTRRWELEAALKEANRQLELAVREKGETLRATEGRYRALLEAIDQGFCVVQLLFDDNAQPIDYRILETNPAFERHTGLVDAAGRRITDLVPDIEPYWIEIYGHIAATGEVRRFTETSAAMGRSFEVEAFRIGAPEMRQVALLFTDITDRQRAEEALRVVNAQLRESDQRKDEFLAMLAHELRNPLGAVRNSVALLQRRPTTLAEVLPVLDRQARHLNGLVDDLLDVSRITRGLVRLNEKPVELRQSIEHAVESMTALIEESQHDIDISLPDEPLMILGDPLRIEQILVNLLSNSTRYTETGGRIEISLMRHDHHAEIRVRDNGIGMSADMLAHVFNLFGQAERGLDRSQGGLGIGLTITRRLVELHGGRIEAFSEGAGHGAEFVVHLPLLADDRQAGGVSPRGDDSRAGATRRIMVVDDNVDVATSLMMVLEASGHQVVIAHDGQEALDQVDGFEPELVLLDIGLPGMDGFEVARRLRQNPRSRGANLVALTGYGQPRDRERTAEAGFDHHFVKPVDVQTLEGYVANLGGAHG